MKIIHALLILLAGVTMGHAATLYYQDFSGSSPVSDQAANNPISDNTPVSTMAAGEVISGGSSGEQSTNGDYTITINTVYSQTDYYIFNETGDPGFKYDDAQYTFESGSISFVDGGITYAGTIKLQSKCNVGGEFFSINSVELVQDDTTGEVYADIDFNYYADTEPGQTDSLLLTLNFGINDTSNLQIEELIGIELGANTTGSGIYRHTLVELLEPSSIEAEAMTLDGFSIEPQAVASNGQVIMLAGGTGTASETLALSGSGFYDIQTVYFDENDGDAVYKLFLDGELIDAWSASRNMGSADPDAGTLVTHQTRKVFLSSGLTLELLAYSNGGEPCRVDRFAFNPSSKDAAVHSMRWNADGTIAGLQLNGTEQLSSQTGLAQLRIFNGDDMKTFDMINATEQNGIVTVIDESQENVKMLFRMEEYAHHLLFRLIGVEQLPLYDNSLNIRVTMPVPGTVNVVTLDDDAKITVSGSSLRFDWTKLGERNRFPGGVFALYADGTPAENDAALAAIEALHGNLPVAVDSLVAHWPMDDGSGTVVADASGYGFDGTLSGGAWTAGRSGGALEFNGSAGPDTVDIPASAFSSINNEITISMWVNGDAEEQPRNDSLFYAEDSVGNRLLNIHLPWSSSVVYWDAGDSSGDYDRIQTNASPSVFEGKWNHWAFTKDAQAGTMKIYLNGSLWHSGTGKTRSLPTVTEARFGSGIDGNYYEGAMDDVRVYNYALSEPEVSELYFSYDGYSAWAVAYGLTGDGALRTADPENGGAGDGYANLAEYALGMNPTNSDSGSGVTVGTVVVGGTNWFELVHARRVDYLEQGLDYQLIDSTNLMGSVVYTNAQNQILIGTEVEGYAFVTNRYATDSSEKFIQLKIRQE
ncbi:LamG domain-containing protein [Pontiellaceae bacterium B12227]|nr:LamG domain-containing protein [Pontiellaceae bacterium B12227]